jgi:hypothetical protein
MRKLALTMSATLLVLGSMALSASAQTQSTGAASRYPGGLSGLWSLLRARIHPGLRPVSLLVPPLLLSGNER